MAGLGRKDFEAGQVLSAADVNGYLMDQSVQRFASAAARDTAIPTPSEGMVCYLDDENDLYAYDGAQWFTLIPVPDPSPDDIITTQGDLIIGGVSGEAVRLPVGAADTVLTSNGTTLSFAAAGGGGSNILFAQLPFDQAVTFPVTIQPFQRFFFSLITNINNAVVGVSLLDSNDNVIGAGGISSEKGFVVTNVTGTVSSFLIKQSIDSVDPVFLRVTSAELVTTTNLDSQIITATQSVTLLKPFYAYLLGGGGAGGGDVGATTRDGGGGGGSGYHTVGTLAAGTYTATIGAGGTGNSGANGSDGGQTSIGSLTANGGSGGTASGQNNVGGDGGAGGSGGGGGLDTGVSGVGSLGGINGASGQDSLNGTGTGGVGSGVPSPPLIAVGTISKQNYTGGQGGGIGVTQSARDNLNNSMGTSALGAGGGGGAATYSTSIASNNLPGGNAGPGVIVLVEVT